MELRVLIESEDAGANEICDAVYTIEKRRRKTLLLITKIVTKLPFHLDGICTIVADSGCVFCEPPAFIHMIMSR